MKYHKLPKIDACPKCGSTCHIFKQDIDDLSYEVRKRDVVNEAVRYGIGILHITCEKCDFPNGTTYHGGDNMKEAVEGWTQYCREWKETRVKRPSIDSTVEDILKEMSLIRGSTGFRVGILEIHNEYEKLLAELEHRGLTLLGLSTKHEKRKKKQK